MTDPYTVYILKCRGGSLYTGIAKDVDARLEQHRAKKGSKYVAARLPAKLVYRELQPTKSAAMKREWAIKQLTRGEKLAFIHDSLHRVKGSKYR